MEESRTELSKSQRDEKKKWRAPQLKKRDQEKGTDDGGSSSTDGPFLS